MSVDRLAARSGGVIGTIGPIRGSGVFSLQERHALSVDNYNDVSLYLKMNGANGSTTFYDSSLDGHAVTANGNAQISTAQSKFGGASAAFDGSGDYLTVVDPALGIGDFTIEFWFKSNSSTQYAQFIGNESNSYTGYSLLLNNNSSSGGQIAIYIGNGLTGLLIASTSTGDWSDDVWHHLALVRDGNSFSIYTDGSINGSGTSSSSMNGTLNCYIGKNNQYAGRDYLGYIDDLRITKGVARYTGNFTPPQREFRP